MLSVPSLIYVTVVIFKYVASDEIEAGLNQNSFNNSPIDTKEIIKKVIENKCSHQYSTTCFKIDMVKFMNKLSSKENYQLLPGVSLVQSDVTNYSKSEMPTEIVVSLVRNNSSTSIELDKYLTQRLHQYFNSLSVKVNLIDNFAMNSLKKWAFQIVTSIAEPTANFITGRSKKHKGDSHAALWTLAAMGIAGLAAMSGKALMTATVALALSLMCLLKGCGHGGGGKSSHYEIITKPAHLHDVEHLSSFSSPYGYARHLVQDRAIPESNSMEPSSHSGEIRDMESKVVPGRTYVPGSHSYIPINEIIAPK